MCISTSSVGAESYSDVAKCQEGQLMHVAQVENCIVTQRVPSTGSQLTKTVCQRLSELFCLSLRRCIPQPQYNPEWHLIEYTIHTYANVCE